MLHEYLQPILHYLTHHPRMAELFAFVVAFAESLPLIGTVIPGSITMTAIGTFIGTAVIPGLPTLIWASVGALIGDCIGFSLGYYFHEGIRRIWPFNKYPKWLIFGEAFFKRHGGKSIVIGRFIGPARSSIPLIAGLLRLSWLRFLCAAIPSAVLWALAYTVPGILLGALALEIPPGKATEFIGIGLITIIALWFLFWAIQRFFKHLGNLINNMINRLWAWLYHHHSSRFFIKAIRNRQNPDDHYQLTMSLLSLLCFLLFLILLINVIYSTVLTNLNQPLFYFFQSLRTEPIDTFFILISLFGRPVTITIASLIVSIGLLFKKQWRAGWHFLGLIFLTSAIIGIMKTIFYSPRPSGFMLLDKSSSFPSGHMTGSLTLIGFLAFLTAQVLKKNWRWLPYTLGSIIIFLVGVSRLYLGAHWFTDVIGSLLLGFALLFAVIVSYRRIPSIRSALNIKPRFFLSLVVISLILPWIYFSYQQFDNMRLRSTPYSIKYTIYYQQWWNNPLEYLPVYRDNRFGKPIQPFNIQWAAHLTEIEKTLEKTGWRLFTSQRTVKNAFQRFASYKPEYHMPLFPWLYLNKPPVLMMIKHIPQQKTIIELRFWSTHVNFYDQDIPLWIGTVDLHLPPHKLIALHKELRIAYGSPDIIEIFQEDTKNYSSKIITISAENRPKRIRPLDWDGKILIVNGKLNKPRTKKIKN